jgi:hypothetical protein
VVHFGAASLFSFDPPRSMTGNICWHLTVCKTASAPDAEIDEARSHQRIGQRHRDDYLIRHVPGAQSSPGVDHDVAGKPIRKKVEMWGASDKRTRLSLRSLYAPCSPQRAYSRRCQNRSISLAKCANAEPR